MSMDGAEPSGERGRSQCRSFHSPGTASSSLPLALLLLPLMALLLLAPLLAPPLPRLLPPAQAGTPPPK